MSSVGKVIPVLVCRDLRAEHEFLVRVFGFEAGELVDTPDGQTVHGEVHAGSTTIWLHRVTAEHELDAPESLGVAGGGLVVHVPDVDAHYERVRAAGGRIDSEPVDEPYGQREYGARDPEGHRWWFATPTTR